METDREGIVTVDSRCGDRSWRDSHCGQHAGVETDREGIVTVQIRRGDKS